MSTFADRMKQARARSQLSQEAVARLAGVTKAAISKTELGLVKNVAMDTLFRIADALQVDPRWLATGRSENPPDPEQSLRIDANKALSTLPPQLRDPLLDIIERSSKAAQTRFWEWVREIET